MKSSKEQKLIYAILLVHEWFEEAWKTKLWFELYNPELGMSPHDFIKYFGIDSLINKIENARGE